MSCSVKYLREVLNWRGNEKSWFLLFALVIVLIVSCVQDFRVGTGSINIRFDNTAKALEPTISLKTNRYQVLFAGPDGSTQEVLLSKEATETSKKDLIAGNWTVTVNALNPSGTIIGSGDATVEVKAAQTTNANITVNELVGNGSLSVVLEGNNPNNSTYTLQVYKNENGSDTLVQEQVFALDETNVLKAQLSLANGFYMFKIVSSNSTETCPVPEAVRIVKGDSLSVAYQIEVDPIGNVIISICNAIIQNPSLKLYLSTSSLHPGDSVTVTARGLESDNYTYEWYLDRKKVAEAIPVQISVHNGTITGAGSIS